MQKNSKAFSKPKVNQKPLVIDALSADSDDHQIRSLLELLFLDVKVRSPQEVSIPIFDH